MARFTLKSRRMGIESVLREFQRTDSGCLSGEGKCSEKALSRIRGLGCTALNGVVDTGYTYGCLLTTEAVELSKNGGLVLAVFRQADSPPDIWLVRANLLVTLERAHTAAD